VFFDLDCGRSVPEPIDMKNLSLLAMSYQLGCGGACPNVAPEPSMYCPSVRIGPCAPAPNLMMFVAPKMKPMMRPTAARNHEQVPRLTSFHLTILPPMRPPIFTVKALAWLWCAFWNIHTFVDGSWRTASSTLRNCCYWRHDCLRCCETACDFGKAFQRCMKVSPTLLRGNPHVTSTFGPLR